MNKFIAVMKKIFNGMATVAGILLGLVTMLAGVNALCRKFFKFSFVWSEELCTYTVILAVFIVLAWLESEDRQLSIDLVKSRLKSDVAKRVMFSAQGLVTLAIMVVIIRGGIAAIQSTYATQAVTYILHIKRYIMYIVVTGLYMLAMFAWLCVYLNKGRHL